MSGRRIAAAEESRRSLAVQSVLRHQHPSHTPTMCPVCVDHMYKYVYRHVDSAVFLLVVLGQTTLLCDPRATEGHHDGHRRGLKVQKSCGAFRIGHMSEDR